ncbi:MAG: TIGR01777 family oxidoreductase [Porphyromonas sp.]|nr:TIGR01777 family oxidoreductase [Porphyromonas sp.]
MIAQALSEKLVQKGYDVRFLTRRKQKENEYEWNTAKKKTETEAFQGVSHIIHLAGAGIADKPWTEKRKQIIRSSRIDSAKLILETLKANKIRIDSFISASAIGFYGTITSEKIFSENDEKGEHFLSDICRDWEQSAQQFVTEGISERTVIARFGVVLSEKGGALPKMVLPVKWYLGAPLRSGKQYLPWIHIEDLCGIILHILQTPSLYGTYNAVAPEHVQNRKFMREIAKTIHRPLLFPPIPKCFLYGILGKRASLLLEGSRVSAEKIIQAGYRFKYDTLKKALNNLLKQTDL